MDYSNKKSIKEFNREEARGRVLDRFTQIEIRVDNKILEHINPDKEKKRFVKEILLNSSILAFGSKIKVLRNIYGKSKHNDFFEDLYQLSNIRNAFAHCDFVEHLTIQIPKEGGEAHVSEHSQKFDVMNSKGTIKSRKVGEILSEFREINNRLREDKDL